MSKTQKLYEKEKMRLESELDALKTCDTCEFQRDIFCVYHYCLRNPIKHEPTIDKWRERK